MTATVRRRAPAKLNLHLEVLGRRDDGYHDLSTVMQAIDVADDVVVRVEPGPRAIEVRCDPPVTDAPDQNLAYRAADALLPPDAQLRVAIDVHKRIPAGGGLGGGSSDAAAVLVALNEAAALGHDVHALARVAVTLGADVPFFVHLAFGEETAALCEGIGERVTPVALPPLQFVLAVPSFGCSTPDVYRALRLNLTQPRVPATVGIERLAGRAGSCERPFNRLATAAFEVAPRLAELREWLDGATGLSFQVSGSGSTLFAIVPTGFTVDTPDLAAAPVGLDRWIVAASARA